METIAEFRAYLMEIHNRLDKPDLPVINVEVQAARMWQTFLPHALKFWTVAGVLERIAAQIAEPSEWADEHDDSNNDDF